MMKQRLQRLYQFLPTMFAIVTATFMLWSMVDPHVAHAKVLGGSVPADTGPVAPAPPSMGAEFWDKYPPGAYSWNSDPSWWKMVTHLGSETVTNGLQALANVLLTILSTMTFAAIALYKSLISPDWIMVPLIKVISGLFHKAVGPIFGALLPVMFIAAIGVLVWRFIQGRFRAVWIGILQMGVSLLVIALAITNFAGTFWAIDHTLNGLTDYVGSVTANAIDSGSGSMFDGIWTSYVVEPWEYGQFGFWSPNNSALNMTASGESYLQREYPKNPPTVKNWIDYTLGSTNNTNGGGATDEVSATNDYVNSQGTGKAAAAGEPANVLADYKGGVVPPSTAAEGLVVALVSLVFAGFAMGFLMIVGYQSFVRELFFVKTLLMGVFAIPVSFVPEYGFGTMWRWVKMALGHWIVRTGVVLYAMLTMTLGVVLGTAVAMASSRITVFSVVDSTGGAQGQGVGALIFTIILTTLLYIASIFYGLPKVNKFLRSAEKKLVLSRVNVEGGVSRSAEAEPGAAATANAGHPDVATVAPPPPHHHHHVARDVALLAGSAAAAVATGGASLVVEGAAAAGAVGAGAVGAEVAGAGVAEAAAGEVAAGVGDSAASKAGMKGAMKVGRGKFKRAHDAIRKANNIRQHIHPQHAEDDSQGQGSQDPTVWNGLEMLTTPPATQPVSAALTAPSQDAPTQIPPASSGVVSGTPAARPSGDDKTSTTDTNADSGQNSSNDSPKLRTWRDRVSGAARRLEGVLDYADNASQDVPMPLTSDFWNQIAGRDMTRAENFEDLPKRALRSLLQRVQGPDGVESTLKQEPDEPRRQRPAKEEQPQRNQISDETLEKLVNTLATQMATQQTEHAERLQELVETISKDQREAQTDTLQKFWGQVELLKQETTQSGLAEETTAPIRESLQSLAQILEQFGAQMTPAMPVQTPQSHTLPVSPDESKTRPSDDES